MSQIRFPADVRELTPVPIGDVLAGRATPPESDGEPTITLANIERVVSAALATQSVAVG